MLLILAEVKDQGFLRDTSPFLGVIRVDLTVGLPLEGFLPSMHTDQSGDADT